LRRNSLSSSRWLFGNFTINRTLCLITLEFERTMEGKMHKTSSNSLSRVSRRIGAQILALVLINAVASTAFGVVFTNPASLPVADAAPIGVANPYPSNINVAGTTGTVTNVTVTLNNFNHTFPDDVDILLVAPGGNNLLLMSDAGATLDARSAYLTFSDTAAAPIADGGPAATGTYRPTNYEAAADVFPAPAPATSTNTTFAAAFNGITANGTWSLYVVDDIGVDVGTIGNGWTINITTSGTPATSFTNSGPIFINDRWGTGNVYPSPITVSGLTGAITDLNVTLTGITHLNPDDLDIVLISPTGKRLVIVSDAGGTTDIAGVTITLDDAAAGQLPDSAVIASGSYRPSNYGTGDTVNDLLPPLASAGTAGGATLGSVFNGTEPNGVWRLYVVDDATGSAGSIGGGWSLDITAGGTYGAKRFTSADFQGDGQTDASIFRPSEGNWWIRSSASYAHAALRFGVSGDVPVPSDYDGDRITDTAVFRNGTWIILNSTTGTASFVNWGTATDIPVPQDYDGDGRVDVAIWRPSTTTFWVQPSGGGSTRIVTVGAAGDLPVRGHFEGTNGADFAVYRPSTGTWYILNNAGTSLRTVQWGVATDVRAQADYDGDGRTDVAVFRPSEGNWYILLSSTSSASILHFGQNGDTPVPGDYDGDSRADIAVWRGATGGWFILNSGTTVPGTAFREDNWGVSGDIPLPFTYIQ
jgi:subtilisin-like proprotein convertase family protein